MLLGLVVFSLYGILLGTCFARLRRLHPDTWEALGQPTTGDGNEPKVWAARQYLLSEECRALGDTVLCDRAHLAYAFGVIGSTLFAAATVVLAFTPLSK